MSDEKLAAIRDYVTKELLNNEDDPGYAISPDGSAERAVAGSTLRHILAMIDPGAYCPPHFYYGMSTNVRGQAKFTCELCGHSFIGWWKDGHEGYSEIGSGCAG